MTTSQTVVRDDAVLVLVDMQCSLADAMGRREPVVGASALLARCAAVLGIPVIVTRQYPRGLGETVPEVLEAVDSHKPVDKVSFSCLAEPSFRERLEGLGRRQVVLAGMETHICVTQTALALSAEGYAVFVAADATCSRRESDYAVALDRLRRAGVTVTTAESVIYEALGSAGTPEFKAVLELVKAHPLG
ncbi:MAG: isochorismatase family protein [Actinobacteria bacterium]|nr:isochorismatase family protein [Actinomycetota bacterium]